MRIGSRKKSGINENNNYRFSYQIKLRSTVDAMLLNAARDLRTKADNVVHAFNKRIATMDDARIKLEMELTEVNLRTDYIQQIVK